METTKKPLLTFVALQLFGGRRFFSHVTVNKNLHPVTFYDRGFVVTSLFHPRVKIYCFTSQCFFNTAPTTQALGLCVIGFYVNKVYFSLIFLFSTTLYVGVLV